MISVVPRHRSFRHHEAELYNENNQPAWMSAFRRSKHAYCPICKSPVRLFSFNATADLFRTDPRGIINLSARGELHRLHNSEGEVMICSRSMYRCFEMRKTLILNKDGYQPAGPMTGT